RNSAQDSDVIAFLSTRKERQDSAKAHIKKVLDEYNVNAVDTLIGDIVPPESLMKTLTDRKIAEEQKVTYDTQKKAQETRQGMEKETAIADMQKDIVKAQQSVEIAERTAHATVKKAEGDATGVKLAVGAEAEATKLRAYAEAESTKARAQADSEAIKLKASAQAEQISLTGNAEAEKILAIGKSTAEAYELAVKAIGGENFTKYKITEELAKGNVKLIPDVLIGGNGNGSAMDGLLGLKLMELMEPKNKEENK
ncbi:MAG: SPFH domain-containing protein, partial [Flavobacteriales bacterium]